MTKNSHILELSKPIRQEEDGLGGLADEGTRARQQAEWAAREESSGLIPSAGRRLVVRGSRREKS